MIYDVFSRLFLAVLVVAYLGFLAALAWWALRGRLRLKDRLVPAFSSGLEGFRALLAKAGRRDPRAPGCPTGHNGSLLSRHGAAHRPRG